MNKFYFRAFNQFIYVLTRAFISLKQKPGFVFSIVSTMGVTLGALLCVLTLAYVMLIKPLPYPDQERLFMAEQIQFDQSNKQNVKGFNYPGLVDFYQNQSIFSSASLVDYSESSLIHHDNAPIINSSFVTPEWFVLSDAKIIKGRVFESTEALDTFNPVAVISYKTWLKLFSKDEDIIGKSVYTRNQNYTIVGVLDKNFIEPKLNGNDFETSIWFPWDYNATSENSRKTWWGRSHKRTIIGKLPEAKSVVQAEISATEYINETWQGHIAGESFFAGWQMKIKLTSFYQRIIGDIAFSIFTLIAGTVCLTLIACLNIINLLLARFTERQQQTAIHAALGARKSNLLVQLFSENILLFSLSLLIALCLSSFGFRVLKQYVSSFLPRVNELNLDVFTWSTAIILGVLFSLFFSIILLRTIKYKNLIGLLTSSNKGVSSSVTQAKRKKFVFGQIVIAFILTFLSTTTAWQAIKVITYDDGINSDRLLSLEIRMEADVLPSRKEMHELVVQAKLALEKLPEIKAVSRSNSPFLTNLNTWSLTELTTLSQVQPQGKNVDEKYFSMSGQRLIEGRFFTREQVKAKEKVMIVNQTLASILFANESVIGQKLSFGTSAQEEYAFTIIGIVSDHHIAGQKIMPPRVYRPNNSFLSMMVETIEGQSLSRKVIEEILGDLSPIFKVYRLESLTKQKSNLLIGQYITITVSITLVCFTIILGAIGLYGILSYSTQMRRFEIGTHLAIGAKRIDMIKLILKDNIYSILLAIATSSVILIILSIIFKETINSYIHWQLLPIFLLTLVLISAISLFACYWPLRKLINHPPVYALKMSE